MTKIAGALNMLPKTFLREGIVNPSTEEAIKIYRADGNYPKFSPRGGRGFSADIKGIFGFKYRKTLS
jgi:hypothetical protein